jgi:hypothetical protein
VEIEMKRLNFQRLSDAIHTTGLAARTFAKGFHQWLHKANWLEILIICIPIALAVTLLPLVLLLFVLCLAWRWLFKLSTNNHSNKILDTGDNHEPTGQ